MATTRRAALIGSLSALFAACGGGGGSADGGSSGGALKGSTQSMSMTAASNSLSYPISIYLPPNSAADRTSLPVIYALDGDWRFATLTQLLDSQNIRAILVGIGNEPARGHDYIPAECGGGGEAAYFDFLRLELIPYVESNIGGDPTRRILWGHSHGGSFVYYALFAEARQSHTFRAYLSADASIPCGIGYFYGIESAYANANADLPVRLHVSYCSNLANAGFAGTIQARSYPGLVEVVGAYGGGHVEMILAAFVDAVGFALAG